MPRAFDLVLLEGDSLWSSFVRNLKGIPLDFVKDLQSRSSEASFLILASEWIWRRKLPFLVLSGNLSGNSSESLRMFEASSLSSPHSEPLPLKSTLSFGRAFPFAS